MEVILICIIFDKTIIKNDYIMCFDFLSKTTKSLQTLTSCTSLNQV